MKAEMDKADQRSILEVARRRRSECRAKLDELKARKARLEKQRSMLPGVEIASDPSIAQDLDTELQHIQDQIVSYSEGDAQEQKLIDTLERQLRAKSALTTFDRLSEELVSISTEIGFMASRVAVLMRSGEERAAQVNQLLEDALPTDSTLRSSSGIGNRKIFPSADGSNGEDRLRALREAGGLGDYVQNRMKSLRILVQAELCRRN